MDLGWVKATIVRGRSAGNAEPDSEFSSVRLNGRSSHIFSYALICFPVNSAMLFAIVPKPDNHAIVHSNARSILSRGCHPSFDAGLAGIQPKNMILVYAGAESRIHDAPLPHMCVSLVAYALDWPNVLIARSEVVGGSETSHPAQGVPQPASGNRAETQSTWLPGTDGLGTAGSKTGCPERNPRIRSGMSLSSVQSPPPMTLPARAVARATWCSCQPVDRKE